MIHAVVEEAAELSAVVLGVFAALSLASRRRDHWAQGFRRRWLLILLIVAAAVVLGQVAEEVLGHESTAIDRAILVWIHVRTPAALVPVFSAMTWSGSSEIIVPAATLLVVLATWLRHR